MDPKQSSAQNGAFNDDREILVCGSNNLKFRRKIDWNEKG